MHYRTSVRVIFLRIRGPKLDSGPESGAEEEVRRVGGYEGKRVCMRVRG